MDRKTQVSAGDGHQDIRITREFDLPRPLLFKAYTEPDLVAQWMGTRVLKLESKPHGSWQFQTVDAQGNVVFQASGVIHTFIPDRQIIRTFEIENAPFGVQLEFLNFEALTDTTSKLTMQIVYKSAELRNKMLQMPFSHGLNMAHNRLQQLVGKGC
ncbi:SRPBCC domain-containing protein [Arsenicibacter rosenii]|uniref:ATPase n=1 Tax=Arsenicibacter rosenii TaxID=1750698 RepID=A0A1S2VCZ8_9BACT|nr:SRPBCC domain-containing protein [Arsenicibacter rosenii]OIN56573.1 ATPase [Arsenicibacter rosenii]